MGVVSPAARAPAAEQGWGCALSPEEPPHCAGSLVVLADEISPFTPHSDFMNLGSMITPGADSGSHWAQNLAGVGARATSTAHIPPQEGTSFLFLQD